MKSWLKKRLTPAKAKQARWTSLAEALEELWGSYFDPALSRLERLRSSYSADDEDLAHKLREMGDYFTYDLPKVEDRPVTLAWRRLELQNKDMEYILKSVFRRHFGHFPVYWLPLFAPKGESYGTSFIPYEGLEDIPQKNLPPEGMFLTSRGVLGVDRAGLYPAGMDKATFRDKAFPLIRRTKPLHIVFDGFLWFIRYDFPFNSSLTAEWATDDYFSLLFSTIGGRFDITPADEIALDASTLGFEREVEHRHLTLLFIPADYPTTWRLDMFPMDGVPEDWFRPDRPLPGYEGMPIMPLFAVRETSRPLSLPAIVGVDLWTDREVRRGFCGGEALFSSSYTMRRRVDASYCIPHPTALPSLDQQPLFDEIPADFMPVDHSYGGYENV